MSFKYRFILSFVLLEVFFIVLIVSLNFITINDSSKKLITQKMDSNISLMEELLKIPLSIYDLATLDNLLENTQKLKYINSIVVLDNQDRIVSKKYKYKFLEIEEFIKNEEDTFVINGDETYFIKSKKVFEEDTYLGSFHIVFDTSENTAFINDNRDRTLFIILIEILISTFLSYVIGSKITEMLTELSRVANYIGEESKIVKIPYQNKKDEIGVLAKSMNQMQKDLFARTNKLKKLASELNSQKKMLIDANKAKDDFLANVSHELKTPLNAINVISSVMKKNKEKQLNDEQVNNMKIINSCGKDLLFLINDILDISKLEAGKVSLKIEPFDLYKSLYSLKEMIEPQVQRKNLEFVFDCSKDIGMVESDSHRVEQIVKNLLSNALKFTNKGKICLIVEEEPKDFITIKVKDDGVGISSEKIEHIFDRFKQADEGISRKYGGTGLGLSICKELITLLKGEIKVESTENVGTTFTINLPRNISLSQVSKTENLVVSSLEMKDYKKQIENVDSSSVLILNNDPVTFLSVVVELKRKHEVEQVATFDEFKNRIKQTVYNYIIVDMECLKNSQLEQIIKKLDTKIILVSKDKLDSSFKSRVYETFSKPFDKEALLTKIV